MRTVYRVLAWIVAVEVLLQAAAISYAIFGFGKWIQEGGVLDKSVMESQASLFPEEVGFMADVPRFSRGLSRRLRLLRVGAVGQAE